MYSVRQWKVEQMGEQEHTPRNHEKVLDILLNCNDVFDTFVS